MVVECAFEVDAEDDTELAQGRRDTALDLSHTLVAKLVPVGDEVSVKDLHTGIPRI